MKLQDFITMIVENLIHTFILNNLYRQVFQDPQKLLFL